MTNIQNLLVPALEQFKKNGIIIIIVYRFGIKTMGKLMIFSNMHEYVQFLQTGTYLDENPLDLIEIPVL